MTFPGRVGKIIGIGGVSRAGKTSLAERIPSFLQGRRCIVFHQDDFVSPEEKIPLIRDRIDWESPQSLDLEKFKISIIQATLSHDWVIAEGLMAFYSKDLVQLYDKKMFVSISYETFLARRKKETRWGEEPDWYIQHVWDSYQKMGILNNSDENVLSLNGEKPFDDQDIRDYLSTNHVVGNQV